MTGYVERAHGLIRTLMSVLSASTLVDDCHWYIALALSFLKYSCVTHKHDQAVLMDINCLDHLGTNGFDFYLYTLLMKSIFLTTH